MTTPTPEPTATVEKLTDEAIKKRIALIGRLVDTRTSKCDDLASETEELLAEKNSLIEAQEAQIDRLKAQLPAEPSE